MSWPLPPHSVKARRPNRLIDKTNTTNKTHEENSRRRQSGDWRVTNGMVPGVVGLMSRRLTGLDCLPRSGVLGLNVGASDFCDAKMLRSLAGQPGCRDDDN